MTFLDESRHNVVMQCRVESLQGHVLYGYAALFSGALNYGRLPAYRKAVAHGHCRT